jgi:hypothetical protein
LVRKRFNKGSDSVYCVEASSHGISGYNTVSYSMWICGVRNRLKPVFQNQVRVTCANVFYITVCVEASLNPSAIALRVVGGNEKGT